MEMLLFAIAALRAIIEMLGLCLIGQGALFAIAGRNSEKNPIYAMFRLITEMPVRLFAHLLPAASGCCSCCGSDSPFCESLFDPAPRSATMRGFPERWMSGLSRTPGKRV